MKVSPILVITLTLISLSLPACNKNDEEAQEKPHKVILTSPLVKNVVITQQYVCQIHSQLHIEVRALVGGYLEPIHIKEGQAVKEGDVLFQVNPILYQAKYDAEVAEVRHADLEYNFTKSLADNPAKAVSRNEVLLYAARLAKARSNMKKAEAELKFATIKAPFDGIIDRLREQQGSLIKERDILTTLSNNSVMWVYFNVPEARYLEDMARGSQRGETQQIDLVLANHDKFPQKCVSLRKEAQFNNETGNIQYRADFPNPDGLLRHGQTGKILIHRKLKNALVIPQRATYEILDKRYVYVVDKDEKVRQREIEVQYELEDIYVIEKGLDVNDKIVLEGVRQVRDGQKLDETEFKKPEDALKNMKFHAE